MPSSTNSISRRAFLARSSLFSSGVTFWVLSAAPAWGKKKKSRGLPPPPTDLPGHVNYLARQVATVPLDESDALTSQIQELVIGHLQDWVAHHPPGTGAAPYDVQVRREIELAFSQLHHPLFAQPAVFTQSWKSSYLTGAGYTLGWSDYDRVNVLALFDTRDGNTRLAGIDHFVPHTDLHYGFPSAPDAASFRFLVYGTRLGKSQLRLSATLYGYDGQSLQSLWELRDAYDGKLEVGKNSLVVRYLKEDEYVQALTYNHKPPRHLAVYKSSPQGLTLESDREIPF